MEGVQKLKCTSCGTTFMSENNNPLCPTCSENSSAHHHGDEHGCGCGGH
jgi:rubrerythrin